MPKSISIKEAMGALGGKLVIGGVPKSGNKDDPDPDRPEKPKPAEVIAPVTEAIKQPHSAVWGSRRGGVYTIRIIVSLSISIFTNHTFSNHKNILIF